MHPKIDTSTISNEPLFYVTPRRPVERNPITQVLMATDEANARLTICCTCEHYRQSLKQCKLCNCIMPVKVRFKQASCPDKRW